MAEDLYAVLGVPRTADAGQIKKAYRKLARDLHPDRNPGNTKSEARFKKVNHAFDVLSDPTKRGLYDEFGEDGLREGFDAERVRQYRQWSSGQGGGRGGGGGFTLEDIFGGGGAGSGGLPDMFGDLFGRSRSRKAARGADVEREVTIDFAAAVRGTTVEVHVAGVAEPVVVRIPPGATDGAKVRIAGHGTAPPGGRGTPGDLLLVLHVDAHPHFRREGDDLHLDLPITIGEAYFGAKVKVPTVDGQVTLKVPERTQSGATLRLRGKGVLRKAKPPGDLYVHFQVQIPEESSSELADLMRRIASFQSDDPREKIAL